VSSDYEREELEQNPEVLNQGDKSEWNALNEEKVSLLHGVVVESSTLQGVNQEDRSEADVPSDDSVGTPKSDEGQLAVSDIEEKSSAAPEDKAVATALITEDEGSPDGETAEKSSTPKRIVTENLMKVNEVDPLGNEFVVSVSEIKSHVEPENKAVLAVRKAKDQVLDWENTGKVSTLKVGDQTIPMETKELDIEVESSLLNADTEVVPSNIEEEPTQIATPLGATDQVLTKKDMAEPELVGQEVQKKEDTDNELVDLAIEDKSAPPLEDKQLSQSPIKEDKYLSEDETAKKSSTQNAAEQSLPTKAHLDDVEFKSTNIPADVSATEEKSSLDIGDKPPALEKNDEILSTEDTLEKPATPENVEEVVQLKATITTKNDNSSMPADNEVANPDTEEKSSEQLENEVTTAVITKKQQVLMEDVSEVKRKEEQLIVDQGVEATVLTSKNVVPLIPGYHGVNVPEAEWKSSSQQAVEPVAVQSKAIMHDADNVCPQIPGYNGLSVPETIEKPLAQEPPLSTTSKSKASHIPKAVIKKEAAKQEDKVETSVPMAESVCPHIPRYNGLAVPEKNEQSSPMEREDKICPQIIGNDGLSVPKVAEREEGASLEDLSEVNVPNGDSICPQIPKYNGLNVPAKSMDSLSQERSEITCPQIRGYDGLHVPEIADKVVLSTEDEERKRDIEQLETKLDNDNNICPLVPGYYGLRVPEASEKLSEINRDEVVLSTEDEERKRDIEQLETKLDNDNNICPLVPGYYGLRVPEASEKLSEINRDEVVLSTEDEERKRDIEQLEKKLDNDTNIYPLIPGYYGLCVPEASEKLSEINLDEEKECKEEIDPAGRSLHWVIRNSDLEPSLNFFGDVLGLCVLRHEENTKPCDMTCNGKSPTPWSKTMMGYKGREEDFAYALEVTYNYGVSQYEKGNGLQKIGIFVTNLESAVEAAGKLGFDVASDNVVIGPDAYSYQLLSKPKDRQEPFAFVSLQVKDLKRSVEFYTTKLGMSLLSPKDVSFKVPDKSSILGFASTKRCEGVPLVLSESDNVLVQDHDGRHAIEMPEEKIRKIYADLQKNHQDLIVHSLRELHDPLGTLIITIIKDYDGYEICLVSAETFQLLVKNGTDYKIPDFEERKLLY